MRRGLFLVKPLLRSCQFRFCRQPYRDHPIIESSRKLNMNAICVNEFGGPEVLKLQDNVPVPQVGENQVLIKVFAAGVNPVETYIRAGTYGRLPTLPYTPGGDGAGLVSAVGSKVKAFQPGQRVYTVFGYGSYAQYQLAEEKNVFTLGEKLSFEQGAAIGVPYFTAYRALVLVTHAVKGEVVLVHGASGAVGLAAVQIAKQLGLTVIGTAGTPEGVQLVKDAGADHVFCHKDTDYKDRINKATSGSGVNVIIEMLANVNLVSDCQLLAVHGRVAIVGSRGSLDFNPRELMPKELSIQGVSLFTSTDSELKEMGDFITKGISSGWVKPIVDKEYPLSEASRAHHEIINSSGAKGKLVLIVSQDSRK